MWNEKAKDVRFWAYYTLEIIDFRTNTALLAEGTTAVMSSSTIQQNHFNSISLRTPVSGPDCFAESDASFGSFSWANFFMTYAKYSKTPLSRSGSVSTLRFQSSRASSGFMKCGCLGLTYRKVPPGTNIRTTSRRHRSILSRTLSGGSHTEPWNLWSLLRSASANQWPGFFRL